MSPSQRDQARARMAAAATRRTEPDAKAPGRTAVRSKPVRITVDLAPELHRELTQWASSAADALDVARLPLADVVRAMIRYTADDVNAGDGVLRTLREMQ